jgi:hypothetical protein
MPEPPINRASPDKLAQRAFNAEFLALLGDKFRYDGTKPTIADSIRYVAERYYVVLGRPQVADYRKQNRGEYQQIIKDIRKFRETLKKAEEKGIDEDMDLIAGMHVSANQLGLSTHHQNPSGDNARKKYDALVDLLNLLELTAEHGKEVFSSRPGPKINQSLEVLVRKAADFWIFDLGRKFTVDHHKGTGTTPSFDFIRALASQLGDFSDTAIVSAMRAQKAALNKIDKAIKRAK